MRFVGGQKVNYITLIKEQGRDKWYCRLWICQCECGKEILVRQSDIGRRLSCGCKSKMKAVNRIRWKIKEQSIYSSEDGECFTLPIDTPAKKGYNLTRGHQYWFAN